MYEITNYLYLDIETIPGSDGIDLSKIKTVNDLLSEAPKSYTKAKQEEWAQDKFYKQTDELNAELRKEALDSLKGRIFCISAAFNDEEPVVFEYSADESKILIEFEKWLDEHIKHLIHVTAFVGRNIQKFDLRFIWHRALKYNLSKLKSKLPVGKFDKRIVDVGDLFDIYSYGIYTKLDDMAKFLGLEGKQGMDGSQVYDYFLESKYDEIHEYCKGDVEITRKIHKMLMQ